MGRELRGITQWWNILSKSMFPLELGSPWASGCVGFLVTSIHRNTIVILEMAMVALIILPNIVVN